jgi:hypothetical protein
MELNFQEKGNYLRGLLILIGKDNIIDNKERRKVLEIGEKLGYDPKFCDDAVNEFLENSYISMEPPIFSSKIIATQFLKDSINLSIVDNDLHTDELEWLEKVASKNGISSEWLDKELGNIVRDYIPEDLVNSNQNLIKQL